MFGIGGTMRQSWSYLTFFLVVAAISGAAYWLRSDEADWWAYVDLPSGRLPKFKLTLPEQLIICGVVGSLIAAPATLVVFCIAMLWSCRTRRCT
jgi:hypothetical protein